MKGILQLGCNFLFLFAVSVALSSCTTETIVIPPPSGAVPGQATTPAAEPTPKPSGGPTPTPATEPLPLMVDVKFFYGGCGCDGFYQNASINLDIQNGIPPFNISEVEPVNERLVTFPVHVGSSFPLVITSRDGLIWEANIDVPYQTACEPPKDSCGGNDDPVSGGSGPTSGGGTGGGGCTEREVQVCKDIVTTINVCVKWTGNGNKCLEYELKDVVNTVCEMKTVCD
jgi:hypothetical protein